MAGYFVVYTGDAGMDKSLLSYLLASGSGRMPVEAARRARNGDDVRGARGESCRGLPCRVCVCEAAAGATVRRG